MIIFSIFEDNLNNIELYYDLGIIVLSSLVYSLIFNLFMPHIRYCLFTPCISFCQSIIGLYIKRKENINITPTRVLSEVKFGLLISGVIIILIAIVLFIIDNPASYDINIRGEVVIGYIIVLVFTLIKTSINQSILGDYNDSKKDLFIFSVILFLLVVCKCSKSKILRKLSVIITIIIGYVLCVISDLIFKNSNYYNVNLYDTSIFSYSMKTIDNISDFLHIHSLSIMIAIPFSIIIISEDLLMVMIYDFLINKPNLNLNKYSKFCFIHGIMMIVSSFLGLVPCTISATFLGYCSLKKPQLNILIISICFVLIISLFYPIISFLYYSPNCIRIIITILSTSQYLQLVFFRITKSRLIMKSPQPLHITSIIIVFGMSYSHIYIGKDYPLYIPLNILLLIVSGILILMFPLHNYPMYKSHLSQRNSSSERNASLQRNPSASSMYNKRLSNIQSHEIASPSTNTRTLHKAKIKTSKRKISTNSYGTLTQDSVKQWNQEKDKEIVPIMKKDKSGL